MPEGLLRRIEIIAFILLCSLGSIAAAWEMRGWGDQLSPIDAFSEANAIREARNFVDHGVTANDGLGNVSYPGLYPHDGFAGYPALFAQSVTPSGVYTHYPPGSEYVLYAAMKLLGPHPISRLRIVPLLISWTAAVFLGIMLRRRFGPTVGWLVMLAMAALPVFHDADSFLHYDGYALALLLVEIGVAVGRNRSIWPFALLGFSQGWLSFDYAFLVTLAPGAIEFAMPRMGIGATARLGLGFWRCFAAGSGFVAAHLLHFAELWAFFGSFHAALHDLGGAAAYRSDLGEAGLLHRVALTLSVLKFYIVGQFPISTFFWQPDAGMANNWRVFRFAGLTMGIWWVVLTHVFILLRFTTKRRGTQNRPIDSDWLAVSLCALVPCILWYIVMLDHALEHPHFLYRHLFFGFFLFVLFSAVAVVQWLRQSTALTRQARAVIPRPMTTESEAR